MGNETFGLAPAAGNRLKGARVLTVNRSLETATLVAKWTFVVALHLLQHAVAQVQ